MLSEPRSSSCPLFPRHGVASPVIPERLLAVGLELPLDHEHRTEHPASALAVPSPTARAQLAETARRVRSFNRPTGACRARIPERLLAVGLELPLDHEHRTEHPAS
jgi:hypothetical protein